MGMRSAKILFDGQIPRPEEIAARIEEITSLPASVHHEQSDELNLTQYKARISFDAAPDCTVTLTVYEPGAVDAWLDDEDPVLTGVLEQSVVGANERAGHQYVHVSGYAGQEPTLFWLTEIALHDLGGKPEEAIPDELFEDYKREITAEELQSRHDDIAKLKKYSLLMGFALLPLLVPLCLIIRVLSIVFLPFKLLWAWRHLRKLNQQN